MLATQSKPYDNNCMTSRESTRGVGEVLISPKNLPWQPHARQRILYEAFEQAMRTVNTETEFLALREQYRVLARKYVIDNKAVDVLVTKVINRPAILKSVRSYEAKSDGHREMIREFESEQLGLPPSKTNNGLHYEQGTTLYPISTIAALVGMSSPELEERYESGRNPSAGSWMAMRVGSFFVPLQVHGRNYVHVDGVEKFSEEGWEAVDAILGAYETRLAES
jgi:hypothetical protein